jgi:spermidine/putrescine-binding protein
MEEQEQINSEFEKTSELINEDLKHLKNLDDLIEESKQVILNFDDYTKEEQEKTCNEFIAEFGSNTDFSIQINNIYSHIELYLQKTNLNLTPIN